MDRRKLRARFFVAPDGTCVKKAWPTDLGRKYKVFQRDGGKCRYCGKRLGWLVRRGQVVDGEHSVSIDHIVPRCRGGQNDMENLALACEPCNRRKGVLLPSEWNPVPSNMEPAA